MILHGDIDVAVDMALCRHARHFFLRCHPAQRNEDDGAMPFFSSIFFSSLRLFAHSHDIRLRYAVRLRRRAR